MTKERRRIVWEEMNHGMKGSWKILHNSFLFIKLPAKKSRLQVTFQPSIAVSNVSLLGSFRRFLLFLEASTKVNIEAFHSFWN